MRSRNRLSIAAAAAVVALVAAPGAGAAIPRIPRIPRLPRAPKVTVFRALVDVAGYIDVKVERDDTYECQPGQDVTIDFHSAFELGRPRRTAITIVNGVLVSGLLVNRGGVTHRG